ncbi:MAG: tetratricopeptide repeat protein [Bacteroidia bacterium]|nr:tetratricopeptide repeat protein [Bacteroidia bacterium]
MSDYSKEEQEHVIKAVGRFEQMLRLKEAYYFEHDDLETIIAYYLEGNFHQKALKAIRFATGQYPDSSVFLLRKSQLLASSGDFEAALALLEELEIFEPGNVEIYITRGGINSMLGKPEASIAAYKLALKIDRSLEDVYLFIAFEFQTLQKYGQAARYLRKCLQMNPDNEPALYEMSFCFDISGKYKAGIQFFNEFIDEHPYSATAWYVLGHMYSGRQDFKRAASAFDYALVIDETYTSAWINKAGCLMALEQYKDAIACYKAAIKLEEPDGYTFLHIGECYENLEEHQQAMDYYQKAVELDEGIADAWAGIGVLMDYAGRSTEAMAYIRRAINLEPENGNLWVLLGDMQQRCGDYQAAEECFEKAITVSPELEEAWIYFSDFLMLQQRADDAFVVMTTCLQYHHENARLVYQSCEVMLRAGREAEAMLMCEFALDLDYKMHEKMLEELPSFGLNSEIRRLIDINRPI